MGKQKRALSKAEQSARLSDLAHERNREGGRFAFQNPLEGKDNIPTANTVSLSNRTNPKKTKKKSKKVPVVVEPEYRYRLEVEQRVYDESDRDSDGYDSEEYDEGKVVLGTYLSHEEAKDALADWIMKCWSAGHDNWEPWNDGGQWLCPKCPEWVIGVSDFLASHSRDRIIEVYFDMYGNLDSYKLGAEIADGYCEHFFFAYSIYQVTGTQKWGKLIESKSATRA